MTKHDISLKFVPENFNTFREKLQDLTRLSDNVKLSITNDSILMYSILGSSQLVLAMKSYQLDTDDYIDLGEVLDTPLDCIILSAKKFVKNIGFVKLDKEIKCDISYRVFDDGCSEVRKFTFKNDKLKLNIQTGDRNEVKNITKDQMNATLDPNKKEWDFNVSTSDFNDISKLAKINSEETRRILDIFAEGGKVKLSERSLWEIEVDDTDQPDANIKINKNYLPFIDTSPTGVDFNVFGNFIFVETENSKLMISFEQTFD
jgi:hypothetical protein